MAKVLAAPLDEVGAALEGFKWDFEKVRGGRAGGVGTDLGAGVGGGYVHYPAFRAGVRLWPSSADACVADCVAVSTRSAAWAGCSW